MLLDRGAGDPRERQRRDPREDALRREVHRPDRSEEGVPSNRCAGGDEIPQNRTTPPIEVETILEKLVPSSRRSIPRRSVPRCTRSRKVSPATRKRSVARTCRARSCSPRRSGRCPRSSGTSSTSRTSRRRSRHRHRPAQRAGRPDARRRGDPRQPRRVPPHVSGLVPLARDLGDILTARQSDLGTSRASSGRSSKRCADREAKLARHSSRRSTGSSVCGSPTCRPVRTGASP